MEELVRHHAERDQSADQEAQFQTIRTKFKLTPGAVAAKEFVARHFDVSQKDASTIAVANFESLVASLSEDTIQDFFSDTLNEQESKERKTHVLTRKTKDRLEHLAERVGRSRDATFEGALRFMQQLVEFQHEKQIKSHRQHLDALRALVDDALDLENTFMRELEKQDPVRQELNRVCLVLEDMLADVEREIETGQALPSDHTFV